MALDKVVEPFLHIRNEMEFNDLLGHGALAGVDAGKVLKEEELCLLQNESRSRTTMMTDYHSQYVLH